MKGLLLLLCLPFVSSSVVEKSTDDIVADIQSLLDEAPTTHPATSLASAPTKAIPNPTPNPTTSLLQSTTAAPFVREAASLMQNGRPNPPFASAMPQLGMPPQMMQPQQQRRWPGMMQPQPQPQRMMPQGMMPPPQQQQQQRSAYNQGMQRFRQQIPTMQPQRQQQQQPQNFNMQQRPTQPPQNQDRRPGWQPPQNHNVFAPKGGIPPPASLFLETTNQGRAEQASTKVMSYHHHHSPEHAQHATTKRHPSLRSMGLPAHLQDAGYDYKEMSKQQLTNDASVQAKKAATAATSLMEEDHREMLDTSIATDGRLQKSHNHLEQQEAAQATARAQVQELMNQKTFNYAERAKKATEPGMDGMSTMYSSSSKSDTMMPSAGSPGASAAFSSSSSALPSASSLGAYDKAAQIQAAENWLSNNNAKQPEKKQAENTVSRFRATSASLVNVGGEDASHFYDAHGGAPMKTFTSTGTVAKNELNGSPTNDNPVDELKEALNAVKNEFDASSHAAAAPAAATESPAAPAALATPRFVRSKATTKMAVSAKSIELPSYSNSQPLKNIGLPKYDNSQPLRRSVDLPKYDNTQPLRHAVDSTAVRFKRAATAMKFPDANKLHWHGWVSKSKDRVKRRIRKVLHD
jgi:hypothetical protein